MKSPPEDVSATTARPRGLRPPAQSGKPAIRMDAGVSLLTLAARRWSYAETDLVEGRCYANK